MTAGSLRTQQRAWAPVSRLVRSVLPRQVYLDGRVDRCAYWSMFHPMSSIRRANASGMGLGTKAIGLVPGAP